MGIETVGNDQWFVQLLQRLGHRSVGRRCGPEIRASYVRKQKTDRRDAGHILKLLIEGRFPRYLLGARRADAETIGSCWFIATSWSRMRTRVKNELQHLMLSQRHAEEAEALEHRRTCCTPETLSLDPWARSPKA